MSTTEKVVVSAQVERVIQERLKQEAEANYTTLSAQVRAILSRHVVRELEREQGRPS